MKRLKTRLMTSMENDCAKELKFEDILKDFLSCKTRRMHIMDQIRAQQARINQQQRNGVRIAGVRVAGAGNAGPRFPAPANARRRNANAGAGNAGNAGMGAVGAGRGCPLNICHQHNCGGNIRADCIPPLGWPFFCPRCPHCRMIAHQLTNGLPQVNFNAPPYYPRRPALPRRVPGMGIVGVIAAPPAANPPAQGLGIVAPVVPAQAPASPVQAPASPALAPASPALAPASPALAPASPVVPVQEQVSPGTSPLAQDIEDMDVEDPVVEDLRADPAEVDLPVAEDLLADTSAGDLPAIVPEAGRRFLAAFADFRIAPAADDLAAAGPSRPRFFPCLVSQVPSSLEDVGVNVRPRGQDLDLSLVDLLNAISLDEEKEEEEEAAFVFSPPLIMEEEVVEEQRPEEQRPEEQRPEEQRPEERPPVVREFVIGSLPNRLRNLLFEDDEVLPFANDDPQLELGTVEERGEQEGASPTECDNPDCGCCDPNCVFGCFKNKKCKCLCHSRRRKTTPSKRSQKNPLDRWIFFPGRHGFRSSRH